VSKDKGRLSPFVPLVITTLDSPAWKAMSHGAKSLYVALKRRVPRGRNRAFISYRDARKEICATPRKLSEWFKELQHYGFIVMVTPAYLGIEGRGKSPHWCLTKLGQTSKASAGGLLEPPTNDFLKWDGTKFQKIESRYPRGKRTATPVGNGSATPWETLPAESATPVVHIEDGESATPVGNITSLTTTSVRPSVRQKLEQQLAALSDELVANTSDRTMKQIHAHMARTRTALRRLNEQEGPEAV
jgi:hypothetical protein